jgi:hypothetical protein
MAESGMNVTRGCWIDLFDAPRLNGKLRRIPGPAIYPKIRSAEDKLAIRIASLFLGPHAYVYLFPHHRPDRGGVWFLPRQKIADLTELKGEHELDSIRILDRPPFHYEPGYGTFVRQSEKQQSDAPSHRKKRRGKRQAG